VEGDQRRARLSAIYSCVAFVSVPFLIFIVPRLYFSLHPDPLLNTRGKPDMDGRILLCAAALVAGATALFFWIVSLWVRVARMERTRAQAVEAG